MAIPYATKNELKQLEGKIENCGSFMREVASFKSEEGVSEYEFNEKFEGSYIICVVFDEADSYYHNTNASFFVIGKNSAQYSTGCVDADFTYMYITNVEGWTDERPTTKISICNPTPTTTKMTEIRVYKAL